MKQQALLGLTLWQPWDHWMAEGVKRIENRDWPPPPGVIGQWVAYHRGKTFDDEGAAQIRTIAPELPPAPKASGSAIVAVARLVAVIRKSKPETVKEALRLGLIAEEDLRWFFREYGWVFHDATRIPEVPCRGMQKLWRVPAEELERVRFGFGAVKGLSHG